VRERSGAASPPVPGGGGGAGRRWLGCLAHARLPCELPSVEGMERHSHRMESDLGCWLDCGEWEDGIMLYSRLDGGPLEGKHMHPHRTRTRTPSRIRTRTRRLECSRCDEWAGPGAAWQRARGLERLHGSARPAPGGSAAANMAYLYSPPPLVRHIRPAPGRLHRGALCTRHNVCGRSRRKGRLRRKTRTGTRPAQEDAKHGMHARVRFPPFPNADYLLC
jgi:hypothetical protein